MLPCPFDREFQQTLIFDGSGEQRDYKIASMGVVRNSNELIAFHDLFNIYKQHMLIYMVLDIKKHMLIFTACFSNRSSN